MAVKKDETHIEENKMEMKEDLTDLPAGDAGQPPVEDPIVDETAKKEGKAKKAKYKYMATKLHMCHPFQNVVMPVDVLVDLELDGWLTSQIEVGMVSKVAC